MLKLSCCAAVILFVTVGARGAAPAVQAMVAADHSPAVLTPFCADVLDENDMVAGDGRHINHEVRSKICRDSEGRIRQEFPFGLGTSDAPGPSSISIVDSRQGVTIELDPATHTGTIRKWRTAAKQQPPVSGPPDAKFDTPATKRAPMNYGPHVGTVTAGKNGGLIYRGPVQPDQLGSADIEGFIVTGTRTTWVAPVGTFGNKEPITLSTEGWYSPDLKVELLNKSQEPRGSQMHKLFNIRILNPDPLLFQAPPDYRMKEELRR